MQEAPTIYVAQREYGIIAPKFDPDGIARIGTSRLIKCYGLAIFDPEVQIGLLAHIDVSWLFKSLASEVAYMNKLGANKFKLQAAGLAQGERRTSRLLRSADELLELISQTATSLGASIEPPEHLGRGRNALLELPQGMRIVNENEVGINPTTMHIWAESREEELMKVTKAVIISRPAECAYRHGVAL